ncbi:hypothetical protein [Spongiactinospora sp. 9N601]|uniref:hypothetical protein n=1 Tax=Spongiactinospora sp. 9N601 TaxID=3375149 RepID=UPI003796D621
MPPARTRPIANRALAQAIKDAGWTHATTAARINAAAAEHGSPLYYDRSAVGHWLTGTTPMPEAVTAAVTAFRRGLGRPDLTAADLGWQQVSQAGAGDNPWDGDPVARLATLGEDDVLNRRSLLSAVAFTTAGLVPPGRPRPAAPPTGGRRGGAGDVDRLRATTAVFADLDDRYGGGHARAAVAAYLSREVAPLLHGTTGPARTPLFRAAGELTYLAAYMAMDAGAPDLAIRYYIATIRLADEVGDRALRATGLRSMAVLAAESGRHAEAMDCAEAAASALGSHGPARTRAWVTGMRAEAHAGIGGRWDALDLLRRAETLVERADSPPEAMWTGAYRRESLQHQTGLTLTALGDHSTAAGHYAASMDSRRPIEQRTRALIGLRAAHAHLLSGQIEQAAATVLTLGPGLRSIVSARVQAELRRVRAGWQPYRGNAQIADADRQITEHVLS